MNRDNPAQRGEDAVRGRNDPRFRTIIDASPTGYVLSDASGRYLKVNTAFCTMFGYEPAELIGQCFTILVPEEQRADLLAGHQVQVAQDRQVEAQLSLRRKDGSPISVLCSMVTIDDDDGQRCTAAFVMDVTEREEAAAALQASETRLRAQYDGFPLPTLTWQRQGAGFVLVDCNRAAEQISAGGTCGLLGTTAAAMYADSPLLLERFARCCTISARWGCRTASCSSRGC